MIILLFHQKHSLICQFPMKMRESTLTVTVFSGRMTQITKMGDFCMYYEEHLPIVNKDNLCTLKNV